MCKPKCICDGGTREGCTHLTHAPCDCSGGPCSPAERQAWEEYWVLYYDPNTSKERLQEAKDKIEYESRISKTAP